MRIEHLYLENFGVYKSRRLEFGDGLQVIYGPNESGKTTLLEALRQTLFGMPHISRYAFDGSPKTKARIRLNDGRIIHLERKKTRGPGLSGEVETSREPLTPESWERCLMGATSGLFENLFAISLDELAAGEESLREAGLAESLFGIAMGGMARFRQLDERLQEQCDQLFSPSGHARKPRINALVREIQAAEKEYEQSRFSVRDYSSLREEIEEHESLAQRLRDDWEVMRLQDRRNERIEAALPIWRQAEQLRSELNDLGPLGLIDSLKLAPLQETVRDLQKVSAELVELESRTAAPTDEQPIPGTDLLVYEAEIRSLADQVVAVRTALQERENFTKESAELRLRISTELSTILPGWSTEKLSELSTGLVHREITQHLAEEFSRVQQSQSQLHERRQEWEIERDRLRRQIQELPAVDRLPGVRELLERGQRVLRELDLLQQSSTPLREIQQRAELLYRQLIRQVGYPDDSDSLFRLTPPLVSTVDLLNSELEPLDRQIEQARARVEDIQQRFEMARGDLARFDQEHEECDRSAVLRLREEREEGWALIAGQIQGNPDLEAIRQWTGGHPERLIELYRERVVRADLMADKLLADAARIAERQQLVIQLERTEEELATASSLIDTLSSKRDLKWMEWRGLWPDSPFTPRSPREMREWLQVWESWKQLQQQCAETIHQQEQRQQRMDSLELELKRAFPDSATLVDGLQAARELESRLAHAEQSRPRWEQELQQVTAKLESLEREQFELSLTLADLTSRKDQFLRQLGLPLEWEIPVVARVVVRLMEVQNLNQQLHMSESRLKWLDQQLRQFESHAEQLFAQIGIHWTGTNSACEELLIQRAALDQRRQQELEQSRRLADRSTSEKLIFRLREQQESRRAQIQVMLRPAGELAGMPADQLMIVVEQINQLRSRIKLLDHQWQAYSDGDANFAEQLQTASLDQVQEERVRLQKSMRERDEERARELAAAETLRQRLRARADETRPLELGQKVEGLRARLGDAIDEWAPLMLARHLMEQARLRFEKNQQPQLLMDSGEIFQRLTMGEYVQLTRAIGKETELLAVPRIGTARSPREMSTGTREQLYLAIRLAYLRQYSQRAEPLPLVMDDVLVNFDEDRARQTLRVLHEFSGKYQILFLTCHRRMVELMRSIMPDLKPLELKPGSFERTDESEAVPTAEVKRPSRSRPKKPDEPDHPVLFR